ncbi:MAG TPA: DUF2752 domain-containing protein [Flavobacterium sp.]|nr:DUF2752 domain-containing protein [Flavobacterium sp.]
MTKNKLYSMIFIACLIGYGWLFFSWHHYQIQNKELTLCLFKKATTIPCPSCGTTRAVIEIFKGNFFNSFVINPFGVLVASIMIICPPWMSYDFIFKKNSFYQFYQKTELFLRTKIIAIPLIILVIANWIWNINKNL